MLCNDNMVSEVFLISCFLYFSTFDLVNIHLFHDASNILAMEKVRLWKKTSRDSIDGLRDGLRDCLRDVVKHRTQ